MSIRKEVIKLSQEGMKVEFVPGGTFPEFSFIHDKDGTRYIGIISSIDDLIRLKKALENVRK